RWFDSTTRRSSRAIAPQPSTKTLRSGDATACSDQRLGGLGGYGRVPAIGVGADGSSELLIEGGAADEDDVVVADPLFDHRVDHHLHVRHGGGEQRRHAEDVGLVLVERLDVLVDVGVDPQIDDLEPGPLEHHPHEVLADVVDVALDRSDDDFADRRGAGLGEQGAEDGHARLHGVRRQEHLGDEEDPVAEVDAHDAHPLHQGLVEDAVGIPAALQQDVGSLHDLVGQAVVQVVVHLLDELLVGEGRQIDLFFAHLRRAPVEQVPRYGTMSDVGTIYRPYLVVQWFKQSFGMTGGRWRL